MSLKAVKSASLKGAGERVESSSLASEHKTAPEEKGRKGPENRANMTRSAARCSSPMEVCVSSRQ